MTKAGQRVAVLYGGTSSEREISLRTGQAFIEALGRLGHDVVAIDLVPEALPQLVSSGADVALLAMHGWLGEGGPLQGVLEWLDLPYTGSGVLASALAMDKVAAKRMFEAAGVPTPDWFVAAGAAGLDEVPGSRLEALGLPVVVKPPLEGSSVGVTLVERREDLAAAVDAASRPGVPALLERCVRGRELSVGLFDGDVLGVVEVVVERGFYDFEAKYQRGDTRYLVPAPLEASMQRRVEGVAQAAWAALGCRGVGRVDVLVDAEGAPWVLEANTIPGMTPTSLVPKMAAAIGWSFDELVARMVAAARTDAGRRAP